MSRADHPTREEDADLEDGGLKARLLWLLADDPRARVAAVRAVTGLALLCGIALSPSLWFSAVRSEMHNLVWMANGYSSYLVECGMYSTACVLST